MIHGVEKTGGAAVPGADPLERDRARLRKATREFEGFFVGLLLKRMRQATLASGLFQESSTSATYREMFDQAVAAEIGQAGAFGIGDLLYRELAPHLEGRKP